MQVKVISEGRGKTRQSVSMQVNAFDAWTMVQEAKLQFSRAEMNMVFMMSKH
jgi:hypothetical protein